LGARELARNDGARSDYMELGREPENQQQDMSQHGVKEPPKSRP